MRLTPKVTVLIAVTLFLIVGTSSALLPNFTKEELISKSEGIVMGTVQDINCSWADDHSQIYTYVTFAIQDQFKGQPVGKELVIQIPGGQVGDMTQWVSDTPKLSVGQQLIVHTFMKETGYPWIYGWEKGVLQVENSAIPAYNMTVDQFRNLVANTK